MPVVHYSQCHNKLFSVKLIMYSFSYPLMRLHLLPQSVNIGYCFVTLWTINYSKCKISRREIKIQSAVGNLDTEQVFFAMAACWTAQNVFTLIYPCAFVFFTKKGERE